MGFTVTYRYFFIIQHPKKPKMECYRINWRKSQNYSSVENRLNNDYFGEIKPSTFIQETRIAIQINRVVWSFKFQKSDQNFTLREVLKIKFKIQVINNLLNTNQTPRILGGYRKTNCTNQILERKWKQMLRRHLKQYHLLEKLIDWPGFDMIKQKRLYLGFTL